MYLIRMPKNTFRGPIELWSNDPTIKNPPVMLYGTIKGMYCNEFEFEDLEQAVYVLSHDKLHICHSHVVAGFKIKKSVKASTTTTKRPITIDGDSFGDFCKYLRDGLTVLGLILRARPCDAYQSKCTLQSEYVVAPKKKEKVAPKPKANTFLSSKRRGFALRAGMNEEECAAIGDDGEYLEVLIKRITKKHPVLALKPGLAMQFAMDGKANIRRMPSYIRQQIAAGTRKRQLDGLHTELGITKQQLDDEETDDDDNDNRIHEPPRKRRRYNNNNNKDNDDDDMWQIVREMQRGQQLILDSLNINMNNDNDNNHNK